MTAFANIFANANAVLDSIHGETITIGGTSYTAIVTVSEDIGERDDEFGRRRVRLGMLDIDIADLASAPAVGTAVVIDSATWRVDDSGHDVVRGCRRMVPIVKVEDEELSRRGYRNQVGR